METLASLTITLASIGASICTIGQLCWITSRRIQAKNS